MFRADPARLAEEILDGAVPARCQISPHVIFRTFKTKWEEEPSFRGLGQFRAGEHANNDYLAGLISVEEVVLSLKQVANGSAPGPDGIRKQDILEWDPECEALTRMFNMWWVTGIVPKRLKICQTTLLPKSPDPRMAMDIGNWRPITIGSMIVRVFTRILSKRLTLASPLHPSQRGFRPTPGCSENIEVLRGLIRHCKSECCSPLAVVSIDFAQAFDSISHEHLVAALKGIGVDPHMVKMVQQLYMNNVTRVKIGGGNTPNIALRVGVKQGDPLSPILFNLALDPLIHKVEQGGNGYCLEGRSVSSLAFADDLVLVSGSWTGMASHLTALDSFCRVTGLKVNQRKCFGFLIRPFRGSYVINNCPSWVLGGTDLQLTGLDDSFKYLGAQCNPWVGIAQPDQASTLDMWVRRLAKSPLKPSQKVTLLNRHAIPRLHYLADHAELGLVKLNRLDGIVRKAVKTWLRLPQSTCDGLLYARNRDGGLGICKLARQVPITQARRWLRLSISSNDVVKTLATSDWAKDHFRQLWLRAGGALMIFHSWDCGTRTQMKTSPAC
ncbi:MAG: RNA-directed DNA polymerase [Aeromonas popoffii]|uniref:RNA-directed DNA polymerase n=1 Tax=Aeromonas popoffii TaxID=70856 RepID=UPI003F36E2DE